MIGTYTVPESLPTNGGLQGVLVTYLEGNEVAQLDRRRIEGTLFIPGSETHEKLWLSVEDHLTAEARLTETQGGIAIEVNPLGYEMIKTYSLLDIPTNPFLQIRVAEHCPEDVLFHAYRLMRTILDVSD